MSIQQTRQGFIFQDYVAIEVFLRRYLERTLREYYVDYLYDSKKEYSHDIRYVVQEGGDSLQHCIEVKTGDSFNEAREKIGKALKEIYEYLMQDKSATYSLYISKDFEKKIATCWEALRNLKLSPLVKISSDQKQKMDYLKKLPHMSKVVITEDNMKDFISRLEIENPSLDLEYSTSHMEGIEAVIAGLIHKVGTSILSVRLDIANNQLALPHQLTQEMVYITSVHAGTNINILPLYREAMAAYFSIANEEVTHKPAQIKTNQKEFEKALMEYEGLEEVTNQISISQATDIGVLEP